MLIATNLCATVLFAASALPEATLPSRPPTLSVALDVGPAVPPVLTAYVLAEAADIWRNAGIQLNWNRQGAASHAPDRRLEGSGLPDPPGVPPPGGRSRFAPLENAFLSGLRVTVGVNRGARESDPHVLPLGWIVFEAGSPRQEIYVSFANASDLLNSSEFVVGRVSTLTNRERYILLGRAMGRALAHEIGHYLLGSKAHTATGIMQARRGAAELFSSSRRGFQVEVTQRQLIAARLDALVAPSD